MAKKHLIPSYLTLMTRARMLATEIRMQAEDQEKSGDKFRALQTHLRSVRYVLIARYLTRRFYGYDIVGRN